MYLSTCNDPPLGPMLADPMRRFPLRLKIAGFAAGLILLATALVMLFAVIPAWRAEQKAQEQIASLVMTALPLGIDLRADGGHFDAARVHALVANPNLVQGVEIVYALFRDEKGHLDPNGSSVNATLLEKASEPLAKLYIQDRDQALGALANGPPQRGIRRLPIRLVGGGRLDVGLSTIAIDAEFRRSLIRDAFVLLVTLVLAVWSALWIARRIAQPLIEERP
jgi:hypothetical protein